MFVVFQWDRCDGEWDHLYFKLEENAEAYASELRKEVSNEVRVVEIGTED